MIGRFESGPLGTSNSRPSPQKPDLDAKSLTPQAHAEKTNLHESPLQKRRLRLLKRTTIQTKLLECCNKKGVLFLNPSLPEKAHAS